MCEQHAETGGSPGQASGPTVDARLCQVAARPAQRAQPAGSMSARIAITRDIALFSLAFEWMRRGYDLPGIFYHGLAGIAVTRVGRTYF